MRFGWDSMSKNFIVRFIDTDKKKHYSNGHRLKLCCNDLYLKKWLQNYQRLHIPLKLYNKRDVLIFTAITNFASAFASSKETYAVFTSIHIHHTHTKLPFTRVW